MASRMILMIFFSTVLILAAAAPHKNDDPGTETSPSFRNSCGTSTFIRATSPYSPLIADCLAIIDQIKPSHVTGTWVEADSIVAKAGTCALRVASVGGTAVVGKEDIINLIYDAVHQFGYENKIGASGAMKCKGNGSQGANWAIICGVASCLRA